jgi:hypothetical protein
MFKKIIMKKKKEGAAEILNLILAAIKKTGVDLKNSKIEKRAHQLAKTVNKIMSKETATQQPSKTKSKPAVILAEAKTGKVNAVKRKVSKITSPPITPKRTKRSTFGKEAV